MAANITDEDLVKEMIRLDTLLEKDPTLMLVKTLEGFNQKRARHFLKKHHRLLYYGKL
jgi:hypothetical protein